MALTDDARQGLETLLREAGGLLLSPRVARGLPASRYQGAGQALVLLARLCASGQQVVLEPWQERSASLDDLEGLLERYPEVDALFDLSGARIRFSDDLTAQNREDIEKLAKQAYKPFAMPHHYTA